MYLLEIPSGSAFRALGMAYKSFNAANSSTLLLAADSALRA